MIYVTKEMVLGNQEALALLHDKNKFSHDIFDVQCDLKCSTGCRQKYTMEFRRIFVVMEFNDGNIVCLPCSRYKKFSGRNNPNVKYLKLNDAFFQNIDTAEKAYLLGWIASDGHVGKGSVSLQLQYRDIEVLKILKNIICPDLTLKIKALSKPENNLQDQVAFTLNSKQIVSDICKHLHISPGPKNSVVKFPTLSNHKLELLFIRGYFEGDGCILNPSDKINYPRCHITSNSREMLLSINKCLANTGTLNGDRLSWDRLKALDFLNKIYSEKINLTLNRKYKLFLYWKENYIFNDPSKIKRGKDHPSYGKSRSQETRLKISFAKVGEKSFTAKLNWKLVKAIRKKYKTGLISIRELATLYNVTGSTISSLLRNETWIDKYFIIPNKSIKKSKKLLPNHIIEIRELLKTQSAKSIATLYNVSKTTILAIKHNKIWKEIK